MPGGSQEMLDDEIVQGFFPDWDVDAMEQATLIHDAGDDVWIAGYGGTTGRAAKIADAIEELGQALRKQEGE